MAEIRGATKLGITVEGLPELQAQFNKLGKMPKKYLTKAGREGIADSERSVKAMAPKGKTGNLKKSIKRKWKPRTNETKGFTDCSITLNLQMFFKSQQQAFMVVNYQKLIILPR